MFKSTTKIYFELEKQIELLRAKLISMKSQKKINRDAYIHLKARLEQVELDQKIVEEILSTALKEAQECEEQIKKYQKLTVINGGKR